MPQYDPRRWRYLTAGMIIFLFPGLPYCWSLFTESIEAYYQCSRAESSLVFMFSMVAFSIGCISGGLVAQRKPLRINIVISAVAIFIGYFTSSFTTEIQQLYFTYSLPIGFSIGFVYIPVINTILPWYFDSPWTVSGLLMGAVGVSIIVMGAPIAHLLRTLGVSHTFLLLSCVLSAVMMGAGSVIKTSPPSQECLGATAPEIDENSGHCNDMKTSKVVRSKSFWMFMLWQFGLLCAGQAIIGQAATVATSIGASIAVATAVASGLSVANGLSRCVWGMLCDRIGLPKVRVITNIIMLAGVVLCILSVSEFSLVLLLLGFFLVGVAYGGATSHVPAFFREMYGRKYYPSNFSVYFFSGLPVAISGTSLMMAGYNAGGYYYAFFIMLALAFGGCIFSLFIGKK